MRLPCWLRGGHLWGSLHQARYRRFFWDVDVGWVHHWVQDCERCGLRKKIGRVSFGEELDVGVLHKATDR